MFLIVFVEHAAANLQRVRQLALLHRQVVGQQGEALHLFVVGQLLLQGVDALLHHLDDAWIGTELLTVLKTDAVGTSILFQERIDRHDECRDELALVGNKAYLVDVLVDQQLRLDHLRSDILAVRRLEEILDALRQEQFTILQIAGIACAEVAIIGKGLLSQVVTVVVATGNRRTLEKNLALFADLDIDWNGQIPPRGH